MSEGPRRLRDDPDFAWETGCDLADEAFAVGGYDLPALKGRLLAEVVPPSAGAPLRSASGMSTWGPLVGAGVALLGLGVLGGLWWATPEPPATTVAPVVVAPAAPAPAAPMARPMPVPVVAPAPPVVPSVPVAPAARPAAPPAAPVATHEAPGPAPAVPVVEAEPEAEAEAAATTVEATPEAAGVDEVASGGLAAELALFDAATGAAAAGRDQEAADGFAAYAEQYPSGSLRDEADLGRLRALVALGDHAAVEGLVAELVDRPGLVAVRDGLVRTRAENLVWLRRCDEALTLVASLPGRDGADVRRACRRR